MRKTLVAGMLVLGLVAVGCDDDADATEAPAAVEEQAVEDAVEQEAEEEVQDEKDEAKEEVEEAKEQISD